MSSHWRLSTSKKRHLTAIDRYYKRCEAVANGHHSKPRHEKHYDWLIEQELVWTRRMNRAMDAER
jgi:hypothetical protein